MLRTITIVLTLLVSGILNAGEMEESKIRQNCLDVHHSYLSEAFYLTKNCVGFSAPVSGRAYGYFTVGMYESVIDLVPELQSLEGQLNGYKRTVKSESELNWMIVANKTDHLLLSYFYRNMPPSNEEHLNHIYDSIDRIYRKSTSKKITEASRKYAEQLAKDVIEWSKTDNADDGFDHNYPEDFEPPVCEACWTKTFPGYLPSLLPYWGKNRPMLNGSQEVAAGMEIYPYSVDTTSVMYKEALMVLENSRDEDPKYELIAEYWNDAAGYSGTPSGHFFSIAQGVAKQQGLELDEAMELYVKLGVAVNEAFISAFYLKYKFSFIRPITYIQANISPNFNTRLSSPPFPEFPSGHSFQSGAASEVMKSVFGDTIAFTDYTNSWRTDIDGTPRTFQSFTEMSDEISISRFYGGIHFRLTLDRSLDYGRRIGKYVSKELKCRKD